MTVNRPGNPYVAGAALGGERGFFGRQDVLDWVARELRNPATNALVLFGQRRIGKTTLLLQLERTLAPDAFLPIYFDLQDQATRPLGNVLADLAGKIAEQAGLDLPEAAQFGDDGRFFHRAFLPQFYETLGEDCRPVFLLDEFDVVDQVAEVELSETVAAKSLLPYLRVVLTEDPRPAFVFAIGRGAGDLSLDFTATFKSSLAREIWVLDRASAEALVRQAEVNGTLRFTDEAVACILSLTSCHPYLTQLLCQRIWERAYAGNPKAPPRIATPEVTAAVPDTLEVGGQALAWLWNGLSPVERIYAAALAEVSGEAGAISEDQVVRMLDEYSARLRTRKVELAPRDLVKRRVLVRAGEGEYRFAVDLFRRWVHQNRPLWDVKEELDRVEPLAEHSFRTGEGFLERDQPEDAARHFRDALEVNPYHFGARLHLGEALLELSRTGEAVVEIERAYELDPLEAHLPLIRALVAHARTLDKAGDEDGALAACDRALGMNPIERTAQEMRATIWKRRGDAAMVRNDLEAALVAYSKAGHTERIDQVKALQEKAETLAALEARALHYEQVELWAAAVGMLERIVRTDPDYKDARDRLNRAREHLPQAVISQDDTPDGLYNQAMGHLLRESWPEAAAILRELIQIAPGYRDAEQKLEYAKRFENLEDNYRIGKAYLEKEQWEAAIGYLGRIADSGEEYRDTHALLEEARRQLRLQALYAEATARLREEKWPEAVKVLEEVIRIDRTYKDAFARLDHARQQSRLQALYGQVLSHLNKEEWSQAIRGLKEIVAEDPNYRDAAARLKEAQWKQELAALYGAAVRSQEAERWEEAIDRFIEIIRQVGVYKDAANRLATVQRQQELVRRFNQGETYLRQGKWAEAVGEFERAYTMDPDYHNVRAILSEAQEQLHIEELRKQGEASLLDGDWRGAIETFEELCTLAPLDTSAVARLEEAKKGLKLEQLYAEGGMHFQRRRWGKAEAAYEELLSLDPDYRDATAKLEIARERLSQGSTFIRVLNHPVLQGFANVAQVIAFVVTAVPVVTALIIAAYHYFGRVVPTPTPRPATLCNGTFDDRFECWEHGGELDQSVKCEGGQCYAVLGNPDYKCEGGVPVGEAWIKQSFQVPQTANPTLSLRYLVFSQDLDNLDYFQVMVNGVELGPFGNPLWNEANCDREAWNSGWQTIKFDLSPYKGQSIEVELRITNGSYEWWNTWAYIDDVEVR